MLDNFPCNAYLIMLSVYRSVDGLLGLLIYAIIVEQMICILVIHFYLACFSKRIHSSAKELLKFAATKQHRVGNFRGKLALEMTIARLNTNKKYGFKYGPLGLVTLETFAKVIE